MKSKHINPICIILAIIAFVFGSKWGWNLYGHNFENHPVSVLIIIFILALGCVIPSSFFPLLIIRRLIRMKLDIAIKNCDKDEIKVLLEHDNGLVDIKDLFSATPIFLAVKNKNLEAVNLLIECGAKTNIKDSKGFSLLQYAENTQNLEIIDVIERNSI